MKRILSIFLASTILLASAVCSFAAEKDIVFSDVDASTAQGKAIMKLAQAGVLHGYEDKTFRPQAEITRAELCKIVNLIFGYSEPDADAFADVTENDWYYSYVTVAKKAGYIKGYEDGTFRGDNNITREETCTILTRVANLYDLGLTSEITDKISDWAVPYVQMVVTNYLMPLEEGNTFRATENITRGEFSEVFAKFLKEPEQQKPTNNSGSVSSGGTSSGGTSSGSSSGSINYTRLNAEVISNLTTALNDLTNFKVKTGSEITAKEADIVDNIIKCVKDAIKLSDSRLIDGDFVKKTYSTEIETVKGIYNSMTSEEASAFEIKAFAGIDNASAFVWLMDTFGLSYDMIK